MERGKLKLVERARRLEQECAKVQDRLESVRPLIDGQPGAEEALMELEKTIDLLARHRLHIGELKRVLAFTERMGRIWADLVDETMDGLVVLQNGRVAYINARFKEIFGYSFRDLKGRRFSDLVPRDELIVLVQVYQGESRGDRLPDRVETQLVAKDGKRIDVAIANWHWILRGEGLGLLVVSDLGEKKRTDRRLASYREYIERIVGEQLEALAKAEDLRDVG